MQNLLRNRRKIGWRAATVSLLLLTPLAHALERVTLSSGFPIDCVRHETMGDKVRLYLVSSGSSSDLLQNANYMDVPSASIVGIEIVPDPPAVPVAPKITVGDRVVAEAEPTAKELHEMLSNAGAAHHVDAELLASVVHAESGGHAHAVSRTGAQGLMQLMPGTASAVGVKNAFAAAENVEGGTRYLDEMLTRYHDNIAYALAAYNAGPGAVDRFRGVPPFRETRMYVARVIREFNRRKAEALKQQASVVAGSIPSSSIAKAK